MGSAFHGNTDMLHIATKSIPVDCANIMSVVERYNTPIRRAFRIIKSETHDLDDEAALQMAVKSVNECAGPDGLVPTLLVFGAMLRPGLTTDRPNSSSVERALAL